MSENSSNLSLPFIQPAQAQKHVTHNEALRLLDTVVQLSVAGRAQTDPPLTPVLGERHIVPMGATGDWAGQDDAIAVASNDGWDFVPPQPGWIAWVADEARLVVFETNGGWTVYTPAIEQVDMLGVNASADMVNRLAVASEATLFSHVGAGHQLKLNKANSVDTASLLYQTNWSGRAEMGLAGEDSFSIKVSADGAAWNTGMNIDATTGVAEFPQGVSVDGQAALHQGNILDPVVLNAGVPSGGVIERGENANGEYTRFADGTQICWHTDTSSDTGQTLWVYPAAFLSGSSPVITATSQQQTAHFASVGVPTATAINFSVWSTSALRAAVATNLVAVGRWG